MRQLKSSLVLPVCVLASLCFVAVPVLDGAGIYFEQHTGLFGRGIVLLGFAITFALALFRAVPRGRDKFNRFGPAGVQIAAFVLVYGFSVGKHVERWNFESRLQQRLEVVDMVERGVIQTGKPGPCDCFYAKLPAGYRSISAAGEILVSRHPGGFSVTFFVRRWGMFPDDDYSAFIYRSDSGQPQTGDEDTIRFLRIEQLMPHWFYVEHT